MAIRDYIGRKHDYLALQNTAPMGDRLLGLELFNQRSNGQICVGPQKLAQRWLLEFLTETGSMPGNPTRGCSFLRLGRTSRLRSGIDIRAAFALASSEVQVNLQAEEYPEMPADERFADAELLGFTIDPNPVQSERSGTSAVSLNLTVRITSQAGESREIIAPISVLP